jgi:DNA polymerase/3'-5' exonuclease PolX
MSLGKGKNKVDGIGVAFAQKIKEFCETGTMEKLEEKRADHA